VRGWRPWTGRGSRQTSNMVTFVLLLAADVLGSSPKIPRIFLSCANCFE
jgi:hypothetical protein